jgi:hypothetical protein
VMSLAPWAQPVAISTNKARGGVSGHHVRYVPPSDLRALLSLHRHQLLFWCRFLIGESFRSGRDPAVAHPAWRTGRSPRGLGHHRPLCGVLVCPRSRFARLGWCCHSSRLVHDPAHTAHGAPRYAGAAGQTRRAIARTQSGKQLAHKNRRRGT